jgi:hypothetical protein
VALAEAEDLPDCPARAKSAPLAAGPCVRLLVQWVAKAAPFRVAARRGAAHHDAELALAQGQGQEPARELSRADSV